jgi:hypothetical protein
MERPKSIRRPSLYKRLRRRLNRAHARHAYIVAGLGRCGTTLVFNSLVRRGYKGDLPFLRRFDDLDSYQNGAVYKTHYLPPESLPDNVKLIYLFGHPIDTIISTHRMINQWGARHHANLGSESFRSNDDIFYRDSLALCEHFDRWYRPQAFPFISIRYEALHLVDTRTALSRFLGFELRLPPNRERRANRSEHSMRDQILEVYRELDRRIEQAEDVRIWRERETQELSRA